MEENYSNTKKLKITGVKKGHKRSKSEILNSSNVIEIPMPDNISKDDCQLETKEIHSINHIIYQNVENEENIPSLTFNTFIDFQKQLQIMQILKILSEPLELLDLSLKVFVKENFEELTSIYSKQTSLLKNLRIIEKSLIENLENHNGKYLYNEFKKIKVSLITLYHSISKPSISNFQPEISNSFEEILTFIS